MIIVNYGSSVTWRGTAIVAVVCVSCAVAASSTSWARPSSIDQSPTSADPANEARINELQLIAQQRFAEKNWEGAREVIARIASIDPHHPKAYLLVMLMQQRRGALGDVVIELDKAGLTSEAGRLYAQGVAAVMERRHEEARDILERALKLYGEMPHPAGLAAGHTALGNLQRRLNRPDLAAAEYEAARRQLESIEDQLGLADLLSNLAKMEREARRPAAGAALQREVLAIRRFLGDEDGEARSLHEIGVCLLEAGDRDGGLSALNEALALRRRRDDRPGAITTLKEIAQAQAAAGDTPAALESLKEARAFAASIPDARQEAEVLRQAGETSLRGGRNDEALAACQASHNQFVAVKDKNQAAAADLCAAAALNRLGEFRQADALLGVVLSAARGMSDKSLEASALIEVTAACVATRDLLRALDSSERALELHTELKNPRGRRADLNNLGIVHHHLGDTERAMRSMKEAFDLAESTGDASDRVVARINVGVLLAEKGDTQAGLQQLESAAAMASSIPATAGRRLRAAASAYIAEIETRLDRLESASKRLDGALALLKEPGDEASTVPLLNQKGGLLRLQQRWDAARKTHTQALEAAHRRGLAEEEWRAHWGLAASLGPLGRNDEALQHGMKAIDGIESVRTRLGTSTLRLRFMADRIGPHETVVGLLLGSSRPATPDRIAQGFHVMERSRARSLLEQMAETEARRRARLDTSLLKEEAAALDRIGEAEVRLASADGKAALSSARRQIDDAETDLRRIEERIRSALMEGAHDPLPASAAQVQEALRDGEALLAYFLGGQAGWVWTLTRSSIAVHEVPGAATIENDIASWRSALASAGGAFEDRKNPIGPDLSKRLLPAGAVPDGARLLIVPDGPLHDLPFEALAPDGRQLVERHDITMLPSASVLRELRRRRGPLQATAFLGVGPPPSFPDAGAPLPAARREVSRIADLFPETQRTVLLDKNASRAALQKLDLSRFRFVHFATHGWIDRSDPRHSGLRLEGDSGDATLLSVPEIQGLQLSAGVVVLSACETAAGERLPGEGVAGLARAFLRAGGSSVVMSLWKIDDESSADFMETFYRELLAKQPAASALRRAKMSFLTSDRPARREAFRWAPFVLIGDPEAGVR